jgi:hypothetical protein
VQRLSDLTDELDVIGVGHDVKIGILRGDRSETVGVAIADVGQSPLKSP